jgi:hypothetical protein
MKKDLLLFFVILFAIFFIISCGNSSSDVAGGGTGGTGIVSSGQITAKGSLTVNGIKYETQGAQIFQDGTAVIDDSQLKVGMVVEIEGTVNSSTGTASIVRFDDSVEGPITFIDVAGREIEVLGQPVLVDDLTNYDNVADLSGLGNGDFVEVSGQLDDLGNIRATFIELKAVPGAEVEVTGFVSGKSGNTLLINNLEIDFSAATLENFGGGQPADGDFVDVKGLLADFDATANTLDAASVENKAQDFDDGLEAEVEGFVETLTVGGFTVVATSGRVDVQVDGATVFSGGVAADVQVGVKIEAEGQILGGVLLADKVSFKDNIRIEVAAAIQADGDPLTVELLRLPAVVVRIDDRTRLDDKRSGAPLPTDPAVLLASINADDALKIRGRVVGGEVLATELEVDDASGNQDRVDLRGPVDADPVDTRFFEILGILIDTDIIPGTTFEDINGNPIDRATFFGNLQAGTPVDVRGDLNPDPAGNLIDASELGLED